jgi:hypothetical protein
MLVRRGHALNGSEVFRATAQRSLELAELLKLTSKVLVVAFMVEKKLIGQVKRGDSGIERPDKGALIGFPFVIVLVNKVDEISIGIHL